MDRTPRTTRPRPIYSRYRPLAFGPVTTAMLAAGTRVVPVHGSEFRIAGNDHTLIVQAGSLTHDAGGFPTGGVL